MRSVREVIGRLGEVLSHPLPGLPAQLAMAPRIGPDRTLTPEAEASCLRAGVMILLYPRDGEPHLVLIRRAAGVLHHKDQIGLPGGQLEAGEDPKTAALRETEEEIGVPRGLITVAGRLTPLFIPPSNFCVYPFVGSAEAAPAFVPEPSEVAGIIEVPLSRLADAATVRTEVWTLRGERVDVPFYAYGTHKIWGATAMVLAEFLAVLRAAILAPNNP